jgi:ABC-type uncharacterized transport system substrate-binding protein
VSALLTACSPVEGQTGKTYRVAVLLPFSTAEALSYRDAFLAAMRDLGYVDGRYVIFDVRTSDRDRVDVPVLADQLIARGPDVLVNDDNAAQLAGRPSD